MNNLKSRSKKIILLFLTFAVIGGGAVLLLKQKKGSGLKDASPIKVVTNPVEFLDVDSDGDGLKDWEETLWKTDLHNPDTDGNGVSDGEEVKKKINQIDAESLKKSASDESKDSSYATDTETATIGKKLFAEYIALRQSGNFNEESINATVNNLVDEVKNKKPVQYYFLKDLKTFPASDKELLKTYANNFASIRDKYQKKYLQDPLMKEGENANLLDPEFMRRLFNISENYRNMAKELAKLSAPKSLAETHLELVNDYMTSADGLKQLSELEDEPIMAMVGVQRHVDASEKENFILKKIAGVIFENDVSFSKNEAGYLWYSI